ncbi:ABC transporter substrate-binding protein [Plectonema cf. radiosum LEGE 06105]|uniref:ABC transporter substrate-binding protein n=1 Tax=Plectonema cf. radiosum LEGE 06105 TaxID=945769 RepID=A0A8J7F5I3_9CYAN|nr:ABC transporter substrate-binding protein [Plectonema cf. radiosum LEGE 06105]
MKRKLLRFLGMLLGFILIIVVFHNLFLSSASTSSDIVNIKLSGWGASSVEQKLLKQLLRDFELEHPDIKVKYEVINDQYMDVIKTRLIGEAAPDVFYLDALEAPFLMSQNVLEPLNSYINSEFDLSDFEDTLLNSFKYESQIYGLPKDYSTLALFYNKQAFKKKDLTNPPVTWKELRTYSQKLTEDINKDGRIDRYGFGEIPELARQAYKIKAFDGEIVNQNGYANFANSEALKGLQLAVEQYQKERTSAQKTDVGTNSGSEMFAQGKVAMVIEGNWTIPYLKETFPNLEFATAEVPTINNKKGTMVFTVAYVMNQKAKHKAQAWELISYLTGKQGMEKWTESGFALPTRKSVAEKLGYEQDDLQSAFLAGVDYATPWQIGKYPILIINNFENQFTSAILGQQTLEQAMKKAQIQANKQIKAMEY